MPNWTARNLAGLVHGWSGTWQDRDGWPEVWPGRRKEAGGPDWRVAAQKLEKWRPIPVSGAARIWERPGVGAMRPENWKSAAAGSVRRQQTTGKSVFKYHKYCVEDGLSVDTPECRSGVSFLPAPADPPPTRRLPGPPASAGCPAGRSFPPASREFLPADADPPPPGATGFDWLPRRSPPPLPVAVPAAPSRRPLGSSSPPTPTRRLPGLPVSTGCPPPAAPSRRTLGSSSPPTPTRRLPGPPVSTGCCAGLFFPPAIPIDPPVSPFAGPPRRTGGVCLPFGRNGGRKCRSRLEYCAEFPSFVTPKHQYHEKPPPRTLCVCGLLQCSAGRMLRA